MADQRSCEAPLALLACPRPLLGYEIIESLCDFDL